MVELLPFRGWHPNPEVADPSSLVCPVYDTLSAADEVSFGHRRYNAAQFVPRPHGMALETFLLSAVGHLGEAIHDRAYLQDEEPGFYVYGIRYRPPLDVTEALEPADRRSEYLLLGLVGTLDIDHLEHGTVALHERTFADRVEERVELTDATGMNFAPIMAGYNLPDHRLNDRVEELLGLDRRLLAFDSSVAPVVSARIDGTSHLLWRLSEPTAIHALQQELTQTRLLILDGHHRFTAAVKRHHEGQRTMPLVMLVEGRDRALQLLPWQRVLPAEVVAPEAVVDAARQAFPSTRPIGAVPSLEKILGHLHEMTRNHRRGFVVVGPGSTFEVTGPASDDAGADFDLLHGFLEEHLNLDPHDLEFVRSARFAVERVPSGTSSAGGTAFLLPGLTEARVEQRAFERGELMAHKSTMFLPKVAEGVVFAAADGVG